MFLYPIISSEQSKKLDDILINHSRRMNVSFVGGVKGIKASVLLILCLFHYGFRLLSIISFVIAYINILKCRFEIRIVLGVCGLCWLRNIYALFC